MRKSTVIPLLLLFLLAFSISGKAQAKRNNGNKPPESFEISNAEFDKLLNSKQGTRYKSKNIILNKAQLSLNNKVIENQQVKLKLSYLKNAHLIIQLNGNDSKLIFIISDDDSVFYNGTFSEKNITMTKCQKDDLFVD